MAEDFPINGQWQIEYGSAHFYVGTLVDEEGLILKVILPENRYSSRLPDRSVNLRIRECIVGFDRNNKPISLYGCILTRSSHGRGLSDLIILVDRAVTNTDGTRWNDIEARTLTFGLSGLHEWVSRSGLVPTQGTIWGYTYERPDDISLEVAPDSRLVIGSSGQASRRANGISITEDSWMSLCWKNPVSIESGVRDYLHRVRMLLSLLSGSRNSLEWLTISETCEEFAHSNAKQVYIDKGPQNHSKNRQSFEMRTTLPQIDKDFEMIASKWFALYESDDMKQVLGLYAALTHYDFHISAQFIFLAQALEGFHASSSAFVSELEPKDQFRVRRRRIIESLTPEDAAWLKDKVVFANNKTFRSRITELVEFAASEIQDVAPDRNEFVERIVTNRNSYTHRYGASSHRRRIPEGKQLAYLGNQMWHLLETLLLVEIGAKKFCARKFASFRGVLPIPSDQKPGY